MKWGGHDGKTKQIEQSFAGTTLPPVAFVSNRNRSGTILELPS